MIEPPYGQPPYGQPPYPGGGPDPYYASLAPKPGCVPLRPLGLGEILQGSLNVIRRNPRATLGLSAIVAVLQSTVLVVVQIFAFAQIAKAVNNSNPGAPTIDVGRALPGEATAIAGALIGSIFSAVLAGMLTVVITEDVLGKRLSIDNVWTRTRPRLARLVVLSLVVGLLPFAGLIALVAPGVWLWGIWAVAVPSLMVEKVGLAGALGRSRALVKGTFWRVWGIRAIGVGVISLAGGLVSVPFALIAAAAAGIDPVSVANASRFTLPTIYVIITAIGSVLTLTFTAPVRAGIDALLYVDLRMRKEGLDVVLQRIAARAERGAVG